MPRHEVVRVVGVETRRMDFAIARIFYFASAGDPISISDDPRYLAPPLRGSGCAAPGEI